jgi:hypothetical protein
LAGLTDARQTGPDAEGGPASVGNIDLRPTRIEGVHAIGFEREGLRRDHYRRRDGKLHSSVITARLFPDAIPRSQ